MKTYNFPTKELYRNRREMSINKFCKKPVSLRRVAYLDTSEALDTLTYLSRGYRPENLYPINLNPAEIAHLTRKIRAAGYSDVNGIGMDFFRAMRERVPEVDIIDFDGTGCLDLEFSKDLTMLILDRPQIILCLMILAGRERDYFREGILEHNQATEDRPYHTSFNTEIRASHFTRMTILARLVSGKLVKSLLDDRPELDTSCFTHVERLFWDVYKSISGQPMLWTVVKYSPHCRISDKEFKKLLRVTSDIDVLCRPLCVEERLFQLNELAASQFRGGRPINHSSLKKCLHSV